MSQLKLTADGGGGTVAIKGPASTTGNNAFELTVPGTASGTILTSNSSVGKILQVVSATKTDTASHSSSTYAAISGLQPSLTPNSTSNKILININLKVGKSHHYADANFKLYRSIGGTETEIFSGDTASNRTVGFFGTNDFENGTGEYIVMPLSSQYLDSPNTTSAVTYLVKWRVTRSSTYLYINRQGQDSDTSGQHRSSSSITLMEVAA